jgi:dTDP-4-amino-4,6-dideoxygalactose transaminase
MSEFIIPRDPRLSAGMLLSSRSHGQDPSLFETRTTYYVFWARSAIYHGLGLLGLAPGDGVLVPSYHCSAAVEPILRYGAEVRFFRIRRDCTPDFDDIVARLDGKTRAIMAIHYFGFPQPIQLFRKLCDERGLYLIEDCAHVLVGVANGARLGTLGDISIFSWRKLLPLYDGGQLVVNNGSLRGRPSFQRGGILFTLKAGKNVLDALLDGTGWVRQSTSLVLRAPYAVARYLLRRVERPVAVLGVDNRALGLDRASLTLPMSLLSRRLVRTADVSRIVGRRRENYAALVEDLRRLRVEPLLAELPNGVCPWVCPVFFPGRRDVHLALREHGLPASTWGGVVHPSLRRADFPDADFLYDNLVFLPIHQSLCQADLQTMLAVVARELESSGREARVMGTGATDRIRDADDKLFVRAAPPRTESSHCDGEARDGVPTQGRLGVD